ncbi:MAG: hypothetical protein Q9225_004909 [Loekoesia sp. 1 TL-2023]
MDRGRDRRLIPLFTLGTMMSALPLPTPTDHQTALQDLQSVSIAIEATDPLLAEAGPHLHILLIPTLLHLEVTDHGLALRDAVQEVLHSEGDTREADIVGDKDRLHREATLPEEIPISDRPREHAATLGLHLLGLGHLYQ